MYQDDCERYESLPQHRQAGTGGSGAARLSCQAAPVSTQWEQHLQSLYAQIEQKWLVSKCDTNHFTRIKGKTVSLRQGETISVCWTEEGFNMNPPEQPTLSEN